MIVIFTGNKEIDTQRESIQGFVEQSKKHEFKIVGIYENQDDPEMAYYSTEKLLRELPDVGGIYINSANSETVCKKVIEKGLGGKIKIVSSDIFPVLADYINQGIVHASIFQDPFTQGRVAFKRLYEYIAEGKRCEEEIFIKPQLIVRGNLELFV